MIFHKKPCLFYKNRLHKKGSQSNARREDRAMHFSIVPTWFRNIHVVVVKTAANHVDSHASFYSHYAQEIEKKVILLKIFKPSIDNCCKSFLALFFFIIKISFVDVSAICFFSPSHKLLKTPSSCFIA